MWVAGSLIAGATGSGIHNPVLGAIQATYPIIAGTVVGSAGLVWVSNDGTVFSINGNGINGVTQVYGTNLSARK